MLIFLSMWIRSLVAVGLLPEGGISYQNDPENDTPSRKIVSYTFRWGRYLYVQLLRKVYKDKENFISSMIYTKRRLFETVLLQQMHLVRSHITPLLVNTGSETFFQVDVYRSQFDISQPGIQCPHDSDIMALCFTTKDEYDNSYSASIALDLRRWNTTLLQDIRGLFEMTMLSLDRMANGHRAIVDPTI